jgi:hypothetical protein
MTFWAVLLIVIALIASDQLDLTAETGYSRKEPRTTMLA